MACTTTDSRPAHCADYVAATLRAPYAVDAAELGFALGRREDYAFRTDRYETLDLEPYFLDNDFRDPDLERFVTIVRDAQPTVAVLGDSADPDRIQDLSDLGRDLRAEGALERPVVVPKSRDALDAVPADVVAGYPNGYSSTTADDYSRTGDWQGLDVHILGGSPQTAWDSIRRLTGASDPHEGLGQWGAAPDSTANVVGMDYNGFFGVAMRGEYWDRETPHWRAADDLSIRGTVRRSLSNIRRFWRERGVWPSEATGSDPTREPTLADLENPVCLRCGRHLDRRDGCGDCDPILVEYDGGGVFGYCSEQCQQWVEYHDSPTPLDLGPAADSWFTQDSERPGWQDPA